LVAISHFGIGSHPVRSHERWDALRKTRHKETR
jgi:hypothetical protein